jgi:hypothetical protein
MLEPTPGKHVHPSVSDPDTLDLLALWNRGMFSLGCAQLQALVIPSLCAELVQCPLSLTIEHRAVLTTAMARFHRLNQCCIVAV